MNPEDDPEARIRQLEQPLADTARASELGGTEPPSGYADPPPPPLAPPPYGYSGPYPGAPLRSSAGNRVFWILAAVFVVGMLALVGGIAVYVAHRVSHGHVLVPSTAPSSSVFSPPRSSPTPSTTKTRTPTAGPSSSPTAPPGASLIVSGINEKKTIACNGNVVTVSGMTNTVTITGHCASLTVSGLNNTIAVDAVDTIDASGLNNHVTYHSGSPKVSKSGDGNVVEQG